MTLTIGTGPFGESNTGAFNFEVKAPRDHVLYMEDSPRRVRAVFGGETVVDSRRAKLMHEQGLLPVYYFPEEDLRTELLEPTEHATHCPSKGDASYRSVRVGDRTAGGETAGELIWYYPDPIPAVAPVKDHPCSYNEKVDLHVDGEDLPRPRTPFS